MARAETFLLHVTLSLSICSSRATPSHLHCEKSTSCAADDPPERTSAADASAHTSLWPTTCLVSNPDGEHIHTADNGSCLM